MRYLLRRATKYIYGHWWSCNLRMVFKDFCYYLMADGSDKRQYLRWFTQELRRVLWGYCSICHRLESILWFSIGDHHECIPF